MFYTDDAGASFKQTTTTWPHDGNDESTAVENQDGSVLLITRSNLTPCTLSEPTSRCLEIAHSTDGGESFLRVGNSTVNQDLRGVPDDISAISVEDAETQPGAHIFFAKDWSGSKHVTGGCTSENWASSLNNSIARFQLNRKTQAGQSTWPNVSIQGLPSTACPGPVGETCFLEGSAHNGSCRGSPSYADLGCNGKLRGNLYTFTCFNIMPAQAPGGSGRLPAMRYGDAVAVQDDSFFGGHFLDSNLSTFSQPVIGPQTTWTLVNPQDANSTAVFTGGAFSLRPGRHPPPYSPPALLSRRNRTIYLSHSENLGPGTPHAQGPRTNGTVRASTDRCVA